MAPLPQNVSPVPSVPQFHRGAMGAGSMAPRPLLEDTSVISGKALGRGPWYLGGGGETVTEALENEQTLLAWWPGSAVPCQSALTTVRRRVTVVLCPPADCRSLQ